jgi:hypothetical protein
VSLRLVPLTISIGAVLMITPPAFASPQATRTISQAVSICEQATQGGKMDFPSESTIYFGANNVGKTKALAALPDLLKRYAATGTNSTIDPPSFFIRFDVSGGGEAWSLIHPKTFTCDVVVTGMSSNQTNEEVVAHLNGSGWKTAISRPSDAGTSLSQFVFVKMMSEVKAPGYGIRAIVKSLGFAPAYAEGVQMEINLAAGQLAMRSSNRRNPNGS